MRHASAEIEIVAPIDVVWRALTETGFYPDWNPFVVRAVAVAGGPAVGERMRVTVQWSDGGRAASLEETTLFAPPGAGPVRTARWDYEFRGPLHALRLVRAVRTQELHELDASRTRYRTRIEFSGAFRRFVPLAKVQDGFDRQAKALKARAEASGRA